VSQLSRKCETLSVSQPYRPPWPVTGIALPYTIIECRPHLRFLAFETSLSGIFNEMQGQIISISVVGVCNVIIFVEESFLFSRKKYLT
jgi:hypothetical protein